MHTSELFRVIKNEIETTERPVCGVAVFDLNSRRTKDFTVTALLGNDNNNDLFVQAENKL